MAWATCHSIPAVDLSITTAQLEEQYDAAMATWQKSPSREALLAIIRDNQPTEGWRIDKVVCIAGGTLLKTYNTRGRMLQFACVMDVADELTQRGHARSSHVSVFVQDPEYLPQDREFFVKKRIAVLDLDIRDTLDLQLAKTHMGPHTLFFEFYCDMAAKKCHQLCVGDNGIFIGSDVEFMRGVDGVSIEVIDRFDEEHNMLDFPHSTDELSPFRHLQIRWRKNHIPAPASQSSNEATESVEETSKLPRMPHHSENTTEPSVNAATHYKTSSRPSSPQPTANLTIEQLEGEFEFVTNAWTKSNCRETLLEWVERPDLSQPKKPLRIDNALCIGTGSFSARSSRSHDDTPSATNDFGLTQFAAAVDLCQELKRLGNAAEPGVKLFLYDSRYAQVDYDLIARKGATVLTAMDIQAGAGPSPLNLGHRTLFVQVRHAAESSKGFNRLVTSLDVLMGLEASAVKIRMELSGDGLLQRR